MEPGTGIACKDHQTALRQRDGRRCPPRTEEASHLSGGVIDPEAGVLRYLDRHGFPGGTAYMIPAGVAVILDGGVGPAGAGKQVRRAGGVHIEVSPWTVSQVTPSRTSLM